MKTGAHRIFSLLIAAILIITAGIPVLSHAAGKVTVVEGLIQNASPDSIVVRDQRFNIRGVPVLNTAGKQVSREQLRQGKKVNIFFDFNRMTSIVIYDDLPE